jgi:hypothetical protein
MSNKGTGLAVVVGLLGSAVALAGLIASEVTRENSKQRPSQRRRQQQTFVSIQPRGLHWWEVSKDYDKADDMPRVLQTSPEDEKFWESLPVHLKPGDAFEHHENYVEALVNSKRCNITNLEQIMRDIPRTFPDEEYFKDTDVQDSMRRVLMAVCVEYPDIGYVQSMNFLAGFLFLHSKTEDACFALFRRLMSHPRMRMEEMYKPGLPLLFKVLNALKKLTERHAPKCDATFEEVGLDYIMFAQTWFMTLFTYSMDWAKVGPIWDVFFERGWEGPIRIALFLIRDNASAITNGDFDTISAVLREACDNAPFDVCARSLALTFDERDREIIASITA